MLFVLKDLPCQFLGHVLKEWCKLSVIHGTDRTSNYDPMAMLSGATYVDIVLWVLQGHHHSNQRHTHHSRNPLCCKHI